MPMLGVGGASRIISEMLPRMNQANVEVALLISRCEDRSFMSKLVQASINVHCINVGIYNPLCVFRILQYIREYDIIHVHLFPSLYWVALANLFVRKPLVFTEHSTRNRRRGKKFLLFLEKWIYNRYDRIVSISKGTDIKLREWLNVSKKDNRFVVINNGIDLQSFNKCKHRRVYPYTLIMIARFAPSKDQATIIKAVSLLNNNVHLVLVGDGDRIEVCKSLSLTLGVEERVHFVGRQSDIPKWIEIADIGIQSSIWEGFGLTAVEMMAGGLPVVASDVEGLRDVVYGAGELFPSGDYERLAKIINQMIEDKDYYELLRSRCISRSKNYDIGTMVNAYIDMYNRIVSKT